MLLLSLPLFLSSKCLCFVPQLSSINLTPSPLRDPPLLSPLSLFTPSFILYSWHCFLFTHFHPHFPYTPSPLLCSHPSSLWHSQAVSSFHPSILLACFLSSFLPDSFSSSQTNGGKYGNVSVTRQEIREDCVNMAGLSQPHQHNVWVRMHIMWVLKT